MRHCFFLLLFFRLSLCNAQNSIEDLFQFKNETCKRLGLPTPTVYDTIAPVEVTMLWQSIHEFNERYLYDLQNDSTIIRVIVLPSFDSSVLMEVSYLARDLKIKMKGESISPPPLNHFNPKLLTRSETNWLKSTENVKNSHHEVLRLYQKAGLKDSSFVRVKEFNLVTQDKDLQLLISSEFLQKIWNLEPLIQSQNFMNDGTTIIIEMYEPNKGYHMVCRKSDEFGVSFENLWLKFEELVESILSKESSN